MQALTVCVEFDDLLELALRSAHRQFDRVLVVTTPEDKATQEVAAHWGADCYRTEAFTKDGADFNKGRAIEEGLNVLGRTGWVCIFDADIQMPAPLPWPVLQRDCLYGARRRVFGLDEWEEGRKNPRWPVYPDLEMAGYFHVFCCEDPHLGKPPWYGTDWRHAGGYDSEFIARWPKKKRVWLPFTVDHLGELGVNWWGRVGPRRDGRPVEGAKARRDRWLKMWADRRDHGYRRETLSGRDPAQEGQILACSPEKARGILLSQALPDVAERRNGGPGL